MRKDNYAVRVMIITPHRGAVTGNEARYTAINEPTSQVDRIDVWRHEAYFRLRIRDVISDGKGATVKAGPKGRGSSPRRRAQSASRSCPRSIVRGQPVLFDPRDLVQVRYEMVRRHQADGQSIRDAADVFGVSRPTFYKAQSALADQGLAGLLPQQRGPKGGHKISVEVIAFVDQLKAENPDLSLPQVIGAIAARFGLDVHRRSLERALTRKKKRLGSP